MPGTVAVAAAYFLHLDALGGMHWNAHDALLGLQCALPVLVLDAALMLPDYSPGTTQKVGLGSGQLWGWEVLHVAGALGVRLQVLAAAKVGA